MNDQQLEQLTEQLWAKLSTPNSRAMVIGTIPPDHLGYEIVKKPPFDAVIIGTLTVGELLFFSNNLVLESLLLGKPVYLWEPGLPPKSQLANDFLLGKLQSAKQELKQFGIQFYGGKDHHTLITIKMAKQLFQERKSIPQGAILTPLARDFLGNTIQ